ncbi:MAG: hypothetical protein ACFHU9_15580 [Fluviicola sp.]
MKKKHLNSLLLIAAISTSSIFNQAAAFEGNEPSPSALEGNHLQYRVEYKNMKKLMSAIDENQFEIEFFKEEKKRNREKGDKIARNISRKHLRKARADLRRNKKHLRIEKQDLASDQLAVYIEDRKEILDTKKELRKAKRQLRKDTRRENQHLLAEDAQQIENLEDQLEVQEQHSDEMVEETFEFFDHLNEEIDETMKS